MRSTTAAELAVLAATTRQEIHRVKMTNGSGTMIDLTSWVEKVSWDEDVDQPVAGCTIEFRRDSFTTQSLSPFRTDSTLNRLDDGVTYAPLLQLNRAVTIEVATTALGIFPQAGDMKLLFQGAVSDFDVAKSPVTVTCRDLGGKLVDRWVESEQNFGSGPGVALETVIQQELDAVLGAGAVTLYTPVSPAYAISPAFQQQKQKLADAILALQQLRGWDARYRWDDGTSAFRYTLLDPNRTKVIPDYTFGPSAYFDVSRLELALADIRNAIKLSYPTGGGNRATLTVTDGPSITEFDRQFLYLQEGDASPIKTSGEATTLLNAALADLKDPKAEQEIEVPFFWPVQLGDLYRFQANGVHYNSDQDWAIVSYRHELSRGKHRTFLTVRGSPCGGYLTWLKRARGQFAGSLPPVRPPVASIVPLNVETDSAFWSLRFSATAGSGGGGTILSWSIFVKKDFATESTLASGDGSTLPHDENITRDPRSTKAIRFVVTDTATGLSATNTFTVPSARPEVNNTGNILRARPLDDALFALRATETDGSTKSSSAYNPQGSIAPIPSGLSILSYNSGGPASGKMWVAFSWSAFTLNRSDGTSISVPASSSLAAPPSPTLSQVAGGALGARTLFARIGYVKNNMIVRVGPEASLAVSAGNLLRVADPGAVSGYDTWVALVGSSSNGEFIQAGTNFGNNFTEPTVGFNSTTTTPYDNTFMPNGVTAFALLSNPSSYYFYPWYDIALAFVVFGAPQAARSDTSAAAQNADTRVGLTLGGSSVPMPTAGLTGSGSLVTGKYV
jgi:hypothetical protein